MQTLNIAGYQFISLSLLPELQLCLQLQCDSLNLKGTILLSHEGINLNLAGTAQNIDAFKTYFSQDIRFKDIVFRESYSSSEPFKHMKVKVKKEIITLHRPEVQPEMQCAPHISPDVFKKWLDEKRDITILDTRNDYEFRFGTFRGAINLQIKDFSDFPEAATKIARDKPIVMFCTGGIRCEKAGTYLLYAGFSEVYQLQGGILNYFARVGGVHYIGECFVFDQRIAVDENLEVSGTKQCTSCEGPINIKEIIPGMTTCPSC